LGHFFTNSSGHPGLGVAASTAKKKFWPLHYRVARCVMPGFNVRFLYPYMKQLTTARVARWHIFKPKIPILGKFWRVLQWKTLVYTYFCNLVYVFYGHFVYFMVTWYIFPRFGMLYDEKSGNPAALQRQPLVKKCDWLSVRRSTLNLEIQF
jgi:hypothetical protein